MIVTGYGESQNQILDHLKRRGPSTTSGIAETLDLNVETVREHLKSLGSDGLVRRAGKRGRGPGRPEIVFALTEAGERLFPNREGEVLRLLASFLEDEGQEALVERFFSEYAAGRREAALARVADLQGRDRLDEVARILTEDGFMAEVEEGDRGPVLRLAHCPLRNVVEATRAPCRVEVGLVKALLGEDLARVSYIPHGDASCSYAVSAGEMQEEACTR